MQLAALGLFVFSVATWPFEERSRRTDWRHGAAPRFGARDALQFVGPGQDTISITGAICPEAAGRYGAIDTLRAMADEGEVYTLIDGNGRVLGDFVITGLDERTGHFLADGTPRKADFALELQRAA